MRALFVISIFRTDYIKTILTDAGKAKQNPLLKHKRNSFGINPRESRYDQQRKVFEL